MRAIVSLMHLSLDGLAARVDERQQPQKLELVSSKTYASGLISVHYRVLR